MWDAGDVDCRMRFIGTDHEVGVRCSGAYGRLSVLGRYLPLVDGIVARQIGVVATVVWVENHDTTISVVETGTEIVAGSGYEMECRPSEGARQ